MGAFFVFFFSLALEVRGSCGHDLVNRDRRRRWWGRGQMERWRERREEVREKKERGVRWL